MQKTNAWLQLFPTPQVGQAVEALAEGWRQMTLRHKSNFNHATSEPDLTFVLTSYLRDVIAHKKKLLGIWTTEESHGIVDYASGKILKRTRTDIAYHWNDTSNNYSVIFEFKKLDTTVTSRKHYYGEKGMQRFVTGTYAIGHPLAFMAGILIGDWNNCVPPLCTDLQLPATAKILEIQKNGGALLTVPSIFPDHATFDTQHLRDKSMVPPTHGTIHISHLFFQFGYPPVAAK